jgi:secreted PhoX family phosphatase
MQSRFTPSRRDLLRSGTALALGPLAQALARATGTAPPRPAAAGPLRPVADQSTGLPLLMLPDGFSYRSFGWAGEPLSDGLGRIPDAADGMGIVKVDGEVFTLVRNHELFSFGGGFGPAACHYEAPCGGGTVTLRWDRASGKLLEARGSLSGTLLNCAGGITPWHSWLSCEEFVAPAGHVGLRGARPYRVERSHGWVFEVPADGASDARPLTALGQFVHEAAIVDPADGTVYLTEDNRPAGFYRLLPTTRARLADGGRLQMLRARVQPDLRRGLRQGQAFDVDWVDIERPEAGVQPDGGNRGVLAQGQAQGGSLFTRLEGVIVGRDEVFFTATDGGDAQAGQVWRYLPSQQRLELFFESPGKSVLDYPDNLSFTPDGRLLLCEDSSQPVQRLFLLARDGGLSEFARNNVVLDAHLGIRGDFRRSEWAGACFSPDGRTLFANVYRPGFTVAISGPFV